MEFFVLPVIVALGIVGVSGLASRLGRRGEKASPHREKRWSASVIVLLGAAGVVVGAAGTAGFMSIDVSTQLRISAQDVSVIQALAAKLPAGAVILNDGTFDAGQWITALTHDVEAEPKSYSASYPDDWRLVAMSQACSDPAGAELALDGMRAVFVGPRSGGPVDTHPWSAACIAALPDLRLVAGSVTGPAGFVVTR
jgi:hypothetical protein